MVYILKYNILKTIPNSFQVINIQFYQDYLVNLNITDYEFAQTNFYIYLVLTINYMNNSKIKSFYNIYQYNKEDKQHWL